MTIGRSPLEVYVFFWFIFNHVASFYCPFFSPIYYKHKILILSLSLNMSLQTDA